MIWGDDRLQTIDAGHHPVEHPSSNASPRIGTGKVDDNPAEHHPVLIDRKAGVGPGVGIVSNDEAAKRRGHVGDLSPGAWPRCRTEQSSREPQGAVIDGGTEQRTAIRKVGLVVDPGLTVSLLGQLVD